MSNENSFWVVAEAKSMRSLKSHYTISHYAKRKKLIT